jgi:hypothetical protein
MDRDSEMQPETNLRPGERDEGTLRVCPHCWNVNTHVLRLCGRCGADMNSALQESGGMRWSAAVQSPVPQPTGRRLPLWLRAILLLLVVLLAIARLVAPLVTSMTLRHSTHQPVPIQRR